MHLMNFSSLHNSQPQGVVKYKEHRFQTAVHIVVQAVLSLSHALFFLLFFLLSFTSSGRVERRMEWNRREKSDSEITAFFTVRFL